MAESRAQPGRGLGRAGGRRLGRSEEDLSGVARAASRDAGGVADDLLGEFLPQLAEAATSGRRLDRPALDAIGAAGRRAAEQGVPVGRAVELYVSAAWRLWRLLPVVAQADEAEPVRLAGEAVLRVVNDALAALVDGYLAARRLMVRREEALRRELIDDLLRGDPDVAGIVERAEPFGLDLTRAHQVALALPGRRWAEVTAATGGLERVILDRFGDRDVLVSAKEGVLAVLVPGIAVAPEQRGRRQPTGELGRVMHAALQSIPSGRPWRIAVGRPYPGVFGIARSYEEAREALDLAGKLGLPDPVAQAEDLLVYRMLLRDQAAIADLIEGVLTPLTLARGGAEPLLATIEAYFATGGVATHAARRLHLSVRAVTYRLGRVRTLTGYDPMNPTDWFTLHAAVLGARLLDWPNRDLPRPT
ncbi:PucR family transcriptional regulator [Micromonospora polyrhachis]|uniref:Sugar diacid utilization regulator n=1 Tax=Micromonospora polyrhachis TaxID=1282883 RepID=A0A7W7SN74_9ACTN|nr:helix-turn-helix domain-containing protein [Micromonospora polyrhachis]MBB4957865.1 sugar diacid utilization regulator [Micromonospora polyrhachis]